MALAWISHRLAVPVRICAGAGRKARPYRDQAYRTIVQGFYRSPPRAPNGNARRKDVPRNYLRAVPNAFCTLLCFTL